MIDCPSGRDIPAGLIARDISLCALKMVSFMPCNKAFIQQACSVKRTEYWPGTSQTINTLKVLSQYTAILTSSLVKTKKPRGSRKAYSSLFEA